jgi:hypothetical protein
VVTVVTGNLVAVSLLQVSLVAAVAAAALMAAAAAAVVLQGLQAVPVTIKGPVAVVPVVAIMEL